MVKIKSFGVFFVMLFVFAAGVNAAVIKGNTYDFSLNQISNVVVEIDSSPKQTYVVKDGSYSFTLGQGSYTITALQKSGAEIIAKTEEKVDVKAEGEFSVDLILFPVIDDGSVDNINSGVSLADKKNPLFIYIVAAVFLFIIIGIAIRFFNKKKVKHAPSKESKKTARKAKPVKNAEKKTEKKSEEKKEEAKEQPKKDVYDSGQIISILKKNGGRATQKDIRKEIPLSEAKISLMIAELESRGKIEKIKKGRGNIKPK